MQILFINSSRDLQIVFINYRCERKQIQLIFLSPQFPHTRAQALGIPDGGDMLAAPYPTELCELAIPNSDVASFAAVILWLGMVSSPQIASLMVKSTELVEILDVPRLSQ